MTVYELTREQLNELKDAYFWSIESNCIIPEYITDAEDIPDDIIFHHWNGVDFVSDDFFCSVVDEIPMRLPF